MQTQSRRDTAAEVAIRRRLFARGLRYRVDVRPVPSLRRKADIVFPRARVAVFVDGCFWHGCETHGNVPSLNKWYWPEKIEGNRRRDADTDSRLLELGWLPIRVWEHESPEAAAKMIETIVRDRL